MTAQGHFWIFLMKEESDGTGVETEMTQERILQTAIQEFGTNGYAASRLNAICSTHGISEDMLYYHFSVKDDLYLA